MVQLMLWALQPLCYQISMKMSSVYRFCWIWSTWVIKMLSDISFTLPAIRVIKFEDTIHELLSPWKPCSGAQRLMQSVVHQAAVIRIFWAWDYCDIMWHNHPSSLHPGIFSIQTQSDYCENYSINIIILAYFWNAIILWGIFQQIYQLHFKLACSFRCLTSCRFWARDLSCRLTDSPIVRG